MVLIVLAIAWRISNNNIEAGNDPDPRSGVVTLGIEPADGDAGNDSAGANSGYGAPNSSSTSNAGDGGGQPQSPPTPPSGNQSGQPAGNNGGVPGGSENGNPAGSSEKASNAGQPETDPSGGNAGTQEEPVRQGEPASPPAGEQAAADKSVHYTVQDGDTLYRILMNAYGKATPDLIEEIASANDMDDPGAISPGDVLILPVIEGYQDPIKP